MLKFLFGELWKGVKALVRVLYVTARVVVGEIVNAHEVLLGELFAEDPNASKPTRRA